MSTGKEPVTSTEKSFWYASAVLPVTVSVCISVNPPELYWTEILNCTVSPNKSPSSVAICICGNVIDTLIRSTFVFVICLVTGLAAVTVTLTGVVDWLLSIPAIFVWSAVPNLELNVTSWKLKSTSCGFVDDAVAFNMVCHLKIHPLNRHSYML